VVCHSERRNPGEARATPIPNQMVGGVQVADRNKQQGGNINVISATVMHLTLHATANTLARRQSDTNLCQGGDALDTDPLASTACGKRWCLRMYSSTRESNHATTPGVSTALAAWLVSKEGWLVASNSVTPQPHCLRNNETTPVSPNTDIRSCSCSEHGYAPLHQRQPEHRCLLRAQLHEVASLPVDARLGTRVVQTYGVDVAP